MSRNIALTGMMGAGKSTIGRSLGRALGRAVADTDEEIVKASRCSIPELFVRHGEEGFRTVESRVIVELGKHGDLVVSLGGGAVLRDDNVADLLLTGVIVMLDVPVDELVRRLERGRERRPLLADGDLRQKVEQMVADRDARYREVADLVVDATKPVDAVVRDVLDWALEQWDVLTPGEHEQVMP